MADADLQYLARWLGGELVAELVGPPAAQPQEDVTASDIRAARIQCLLGLVDDLSGSYRADGVERWMRRPRYQLGGRAPRDLFSSNWHPSDEPILRVRRLARALVGYRGNDPTSRVATDAGDEDHP